MKIKIGGSFYKEFNGLSVSTNLNSVASTFAFSGFYDKENKDHRKIFRPLSFLDCDMYNDNDQKFITGKIISHSFNSQNVKNLVVLSGYSNGGILEDCSIPFESYPLESIGRSLKDISERLLKYFNIGLIIDKSVQNECGLIYEKSCGEPSGSVKDYLAKLAIQRNVIMSHDRNGNVIYYRPNINAPSKKLYTKENTLNMSLDVQGQGFHSEISILKQPSKKDGAGVSYSDSIINNLVGRYRPAVQIMTSGEDGETEKGTKSFLAEELKNIKINMDFDNWQPLYIGDIVEVENEEIYINQRTRFIVESTQINENSKGRSMSMTVVLPESFTGDLPKNIFNF